MKTPRSFLVAVAGLALAPVHAGDEFSATNPIDYSRPARSGGEDWEFAIGPYIWFTSVDGQAGQTGLVAPIDIDFGDILDDLDMAFLASAEIRRGRWGLLSTLTWLDVSSADANGGPLYDRVRLDLEQTIFDLRLAYRVMEGRTSIDLIAGARYMAVDANTKFTGGLLGGAAVNEDADWIDPLVGLQLAYDLNDRWVTELRADVGGFGVSSELSWEVFAGLGYRLNDSVLIYGGYRHLDIDYDRQFKFDAEISGLFLGVDFQF